MRKILLTTLAINLILLSLNAQENERAAGVRGGITSGFTYRQNLEYNFSYEGLLSFRKNGLQFTLLRQIHEESFFDIGNNNLYFVYGYGAHAGFLFSRDYRIFVNEHVYFPERRFSPVVGVDAYGAIEYRLDTFPLIVALDFKPFFELSTYQFFRLNLWDMAFAVKYRF